MRIYQSCDGSGNWTTYKADGSVLSTVADLQPGINEAQSTGFPLVVEGNINFPITEPAHFGPSSFQSYTLKNVVLNVSGSVPAVTFDAMHGAHLEWSGAIKYSGSADSAVSIKPQNVCPTPSWYPGAVQAHPYGVRND